ncbi:hypothetical protein PybrP1_004930 [[Pythium] brassicae (nom. inval.)]|nr:hypothetical protein PybrP1_004930 [[Pythium] brassicae (nom. inval.)]
MERLGVTAAWCSAVERSCMKPNLLPLISHKVLCCTHGAFQETRSKGKRTHTVRYTGCQARLVARVKPIDDGAIAVWRVVMEKEAVTHNHTTTKIKGPALVTSRSIAKNIELMKVVTAINDEHTLSTKITQFVSDKIGACEVRRSNRVRRRCECDVWCASAGLNVSPQLIWNLLRRPLGGESAETGVKDMLTRLVEEDNSDILLLLQDQLDLICAIVIQTSAQRAVFKHWGHTLAMDWTQHE